jgi:alkylation response protein AidB-like acyl-CoA dehydrogenase
VSNDRDQRLAGVRDDVRAWLEGEFSSDLTLRTWWGRLADSGWGFPTWPKEWCGRDLGGGEARAVADELARAEVVGPPGGLGQMMGAPVVIQYGDDDQRQRFVRALAAGEESWCQFFSEPGAGSDLASLQTKAVRDGDEWVVNGQKVWTSGARQADRGMLVARTNPDAPKHKGITYFIIDLDQPGIEIRPLKQMNGQASFNEVFFTDARVSDRDVIGGVNDGWAVAVTTLAFERSGLGGGGPRGALVLPGRRGGMLDRTVGNILANRPKASADGPASAYGFPRTGAAMADLARKRGVAADPILRQRIAALEADVQLNRLTGLRARAAAQRGKQPGPEASTGKLAASNIARRARDLGLTLLGADGMLADDDAPLDGSVQRMALSAPAASIAGGTDEVQRNVVGERVLGLPREPDVYRDVPFRDLTVGTQRTQPG